MSESDRNGTPRFKAPRGGIVSAVFQDASSAEEAYDAAAGTTGTILGALVGAGMSEERATVYRTAIEDGGVVLAVHPRDEEDAETLEERWEDAGGEDVFRG